MTTISLLDLPNELIFEVLLSLPLEEIIDKCRTSTFVNNFCKEDYFWELYSKRMKLPQKKGPGTWKEYVKNYHLSFVKDIKVKIPKRDFLSKEMIENCFWLRTELLDILNRKVNGNLSSVKVRDEGSFIILVIHLVEKINKEIVTEEFIKSITAAVIFTCSNSATKVLSYQQKAFDRKKTLRRL